MLLLLAVLLAAAPLMSADSEGRLAGRSAGRLAGRQAVQAARGGSATLRCEVTDALDSQVSWVRSRDLQILAHGGAVFTADARVSAGAVGAVEGAAGAVGAVKRQHWLSVSGLRDSDAGRYECQLNTEPKQSLFIDLIVIDPTVSVVTETASTTAMPIEIEDENGAAGAARQTDAMQRDQAVAGGARRPGGGTGGGTGWLALVILVLCAAAG